MPVKKGYKGDYKKVMTQIRKYYRQSKYENRVYASRGEEDSSAFCYACLQWVGCLGRVIEEHFDRTRVRKYHDMKNYEAFDAFLTEPIKNALCEDVLGEILTFLCKTSTKYEIGNVLGLTPEDEEEGAKAWII